MSPELAAIINPTVLILLLLIGMTNTVGPIGMFFVFRGYVREQVDSSKSNKAVLDEAIAQSKSLRESVLPRIEQVATDVSRHSQQAEERHDKEFQVQSTIATAVENQTKLSEKLANLMEEFSKENQNTNHEISRTATSMQAIETMMSDIKTQLESIRKRLDQSPSVTPALEELTQSINALAALIRAEATNVVQTDISTDSDSPESATPEQADSETGQGEDNV